jgi:hypothetical protein
VTKKKGVLARLAGLLGGGASSPDDVVPPVDLGVPVTNPALVAAIRKHLRTQRSESAAALLDALKRSFLLTAVVMEDRPVPAARGQTMFRKGDRFGVIEVLDESDARLLALFTDQDELRRFTDKANSTLVMPAGDAMAFVLEHHYTGMVVNPASVETLRLDAPFIRTLGAVG